MFPAGDLNIGYIVVYANTSSDNFLTVMRSILSEHPNIITLMGIRKSKMVEALAPTVNSLRLV